MTRRKAGVFALALPIMGAGVLCIGIPAQAQRGAQPDVSPTTQFDPARDVGIDQKLNDPVPLDTTFRDETGKTVRLGDYVNGKPVVLNLIFYKCTGSCPLQLDGMVAVFRRLKFKIGEEFNVVTVSINPNETPVDAAMKQQELMVGLQQPGAANGWHLLTGTEDQIQRLAKAVGFRYRYNPKTNQYAHTVGLILLTPQGKISRYLMGAGYSPKDLRLSLVEASENKIGTLADKVYLLCSDYDPKTGKYGVVVMKVVRLLSIGMILILGGGIFVALRLEKRRAARLNANPKDSAPLANA